MNSHVRTLARCFSVLASVAALFAAAPLAHAQSPAAVQYAVGSPAMAQALDIARRHWGTEPCGGQVDLAWDTLETRTNAAASWANPLGAYTRPASNVACSIRINAAASWTWEKFCTVVVHELGHLAGHAHVEDAHDVMATYYTQPLAACVTEKDPTAVAVAPLQSAKPSGRTAPKKRTKAAKKRFTVR